MNRLVLFLFTIFGFVACTEPITLYPENADPTLVVYSTLTDEYKNQSVRLTASTPYFEAVPNQPVSNARVTVTSSNNEVYTFVEDADSLGTYFSLRPWAARVGETYRLAVSAAVMDETLSYEAQTTLPTPLELDSIKITPLTIMGHANHQLTAYFLDEPTEDYFFFQVIYNDSILATGISNQIISDDQAANGQYIKGNLGFFNDRSEWETDSPESREQSIYLSPGDRITVLSSKIEKGYFDFLRQCNNQKNGENPLFGGPASNITTNLNNGAVGYFTSYCLRATKMVFEEEKTN